MGLIPYEQLTIDGKNCSEYGVWISGGGTFNAPPRDMDTISIPGRDGDIFFDNGRFQNINVTYPAFISKRFAPRMDDFRAWLCSKYQYMKIEVLTLLLKPSKQFMQLKQTSMQATVPNLMKRQEVIK